MKKLITLAMLVMMTFATGFKAMAIEDPFPTGTTIASARFGVVPGFGGNVTADYVLVDHWWKGHFTIGGYLGFNTRKFAPQYTDRFHEYNVSVMPRATYGLNITNDFEVHAGIMTGVCMQYDNYNKNLTFNYDLGEIAGVRYQLFTDFYVDFEANYTFYMSYLNFGVTYLF